MENLKIVYMPVTALTPYERNAKEHPPEQIEQIKKSIHDYEMVDPIGIWGENNIIVEGHGRLLACKALGMTEVPCIRLDHMTDEQRREYALVHNQTTMNSPFDLSTLNLEINDLQGFDAEFFGFASQNQEKSDDDKYTKATKIPQYEPKAEAPEVFELIDDGKVNYLLAEIESANLTKEEKSFLRMAAYRHAVIDFDRVADYYASASPEMQMLMEHSALVIIDIDDAIANGFTTLTEGVVEIMDGGGDEE